MITIQDINSKIISGDLTNEQLDSITMAIRFARNQLATKNKFTMRVGSKVKFTSSKSGRTILATVEKINRKFVVVRENGKVHSVWRVPANMLDTVEE